jgi:hypothetical protein
VKNVTFECDETLMFWFEIKSVFVVNLGDKCLECVVKVQKFVFFFYEQTVAAFYGM